MHIICITTALGNGGGISMTPTISALLKLDIIIIIIITVIINMV